MNELTDAIKSIEEEIEELTKRKEFLENIDITKVPNEDEWHEMCLSDLRHSDLLGIFITNIFPNAADIKIGCNYAQFSLYDFICYIPTSNIRGIEIDTKWFVKTKKPIYMDNHTTYIPPVLSVLTKYVNATNWDEKSKAIIGANYKKWYRFILWNFKYRFNHKQYVDRYNSQKDDYDKRFNLLVEQHNETVRKQKELIYKMENVLIPELSKFTDRIKIHRPTISYSSIDSLEKILNYYKEN